MPDTLPKDVGLCASCGAKNSLRSTRCYACFAELPWKKPEKAVTYKAPKTAKVGSSISNISISTDKAESMVQNIGNTLAFLISFVIPPMGYVMWRMMRVLDIPFVPAAGNGALFGGLTYLVLWAHFTQTSHAPLNVTPSS